MVFNLDYMYVHLTTAWLRINIVLFTAMYININVNRFSVSKFVIVFINLRKFAN